MFAQRIVVERMKEEAESSRRAAAAAAVAAKASGDAGPSKGTLIIRMNDQGVIVTESVNAFGDPSPALDAGSDAAATAAAATSAAAAADGDIEEERRQRKAFLTLLRMTLHLLLALKKDDPNPLNDQVLQPVWFKSVTRVVLVKSSSSSFSRKHDSISNVTILDVA